MRMWVRSYFSILACMSVLLTSTVVNGATNLVFYVSLDDEISITASGGEIVNGPGVFVPRVEGAAFGGNGSVYANWDNDDVGGLFEGWDDDAGSTIDLYFRGDHWDSHSGDSGFWSVVDRYGGNDGYYILSVRDGKLRFPYKDSYNGYAEAPHLTGITLANNVTYRLTVRQFDTDFEVYLDGGAYSNSSPVYSENTWNETIAFPQNNTGSPGRQMSVGDRAIFGGLLQSGEWVDEIRVYNGFYSPAELDVPLVKGHYPADGAENIPADTFLSWNPPEDRLLDEKPARYNVYFGSEPNELSPHFNFALVSESQEETFYNPGDEVALEMLTDYYWRVDVVDPNNGVPVVYTCGAADPNFDPSVVYTCDLLHFTTVPPKATVPVPEDGATGVAQNVMLRWNSGYGADEHDIYLDPNELLVAAGDDSVRLPRQSGTSYVCDLAWETEYFWRVDEVFAGAGEPEAGDVWSFTTGTPECEFELGGDVNKDCAVNLEDLAIMAMNWLQCNLTNGNCP
ncbi:MAG: hypothetical protein J7M40_13025 [Planctomycetes bacterium]|nr:hypothetical protein [Planctomycetota bacterium]